LWSWLGNMIGDSVQAQLQAPKGQRVERYCTIQVNDKNFPINACDFLLRHEYASLCYNTLYNNNKETRRRKAENPQIRFFSIARQPAKVAMEGGHTKKPTPSWLPYFTCPVNFFIQDHWQLDPSASHTHCSAEILATLHRSLRHLDFKLRRCRPWAPLGAS